MQLLKQDLQQHADKVYGTIIVGGGVGVLSAGIYLQRYLLNSLIIDKGATGIWREIRRERGVKRRLDVDFPVSF